MTDISIVKEFCIGMHLNEEKRREEAGDDD